MVNPRFQSNVTLAWSWRALSLSRKGCPSPRTPLPLTSHLSPPTLTLTLSLSTLPIIRIQYDSETRCRTPRALVFPNLGPAPRAFPYPNPSSPSSRSNSCRCARTTRGLLQAVLRFHDLQPDHLPCRQVFLSAT